MPNLHVFNAKPINKHAKNEKDDNIDKDSSLVADKNPQTQTEEMRDHVSGKNFKDPLKGQGRDGPGSPSDFDMKKKLKGKKEGTRNNASEDLSHEDEKKDQLEKKKSKHHMLGESKIGNLKSDPDSEKQSKPESGEKNDKPPKRKGPSQEEDDANVKKKLQKKAKVKRGELDVIDDAEVSFVDLFTADGVEDFEKGREKEVKDYASRDKKSAGAIVTFPGKRKKSKAQSTGSILDFSPAIEVGMGGASAWGDE